MGGAGSGRIFRWNTRTITMSQHSIDIRWMKKQKYLQSASFGSLFWSSRGERAGAINFRMEEAEMILNYRHKTCDGEWENVKQVVLIDQTSCNYGGFRKWFICPRCFKRVAALYGAGKYFYCRHCYNLIYNSCNCSPIQRIFDKANNLRKKLGGNAGIAYSTPDR